MTRGSLGIEGILVAILSLLCQDRTHTATLILAIPQVSPLAQEKVGILITYSGAGASNTCSFHTGIKATYPKVAFICNYSNFANYPFKLVEPGMTCIIQLLRGIRGG